MGPWLLSAPSTEKNTHKQQESEGCDTQTFLDILYEACSLHQRH